MKTNPTIKSCDTLLKFIDDEEDGGIIRMPTENFRRIIQFLKQSTEKNQSIVGLRYKRYDGVEFKDTPFNLLYEGGWAVEEVPDREEEMRGMLERCLESFKYIHANASFAFHESNTDDHIEHLPYRMQELEQLLNELKQTT